MAHAVDSAGSKRLQIAERFTQIERQLSSQPTIDDALRTITRSSLELIPSAEHAAVSRGRAGGRFQTIASTSDLPPRVDQIQYDLGTGPCVDSLLTASPFRVGDLSHTSVWPEFGRRACEEYGIRSMLSVRMFLEDDELLIGLNIYSSELDAFDESDQATATLLATHGALAVTAARSKDKADNLQRALYTSRRIGIALGILMASHKITEHQAFDLMRIASQNTHRKIADIAEEVAQTGLLELPELPEDRRRS